MAQENESARKSLEEWRKEIDALDTELLRLLNRRARIACALGAIKVASGLPAYDGRRERQVLARVCAQNPGPFSPDSISSIFRTIILETRKIGIQSMRNVKSIQMVKSKNNARAEERRNGDQHGSRSN